ncbi:hypothetical protein [Pseudomonas zhanjiangensis]|uniref:PXPV repeat-containing protein n=1 Tax=Pseudomonas zhanjiangensis TaxID=3239015 RepID=A0ABV3YXK7_9PSED
MNSRMLGCAAMLASLALAGITPAQASDRHAIITGAAVGALIGGSIAVQAHHGRVPVYIQIGPAPPRGVYYYQAPPRYYAPPPVYYRSYSVRPHGGRAYPLIVAPHYRFNPRSHRHHYRKHHHRQHGFGPRR